MKSFRHPTRSPLLRFVARLLIVAFSFALLPPTPAAAARTNGDHLARSLPTPAPSPPAATADPHPVLRLVLLLDGEDVRAWLVVPDPEFAGNYHRARWMDPAVGRFVGMDPWEGLTNDPVSLHKYLYAVGDPVDRLDPTGLNSSSLAGTLTVASSIVTLVSRAAVPTLRALQSVSRFFWHNRAFARVSRAYWSKYGPAAGRSLHHWLIPQRATWVPQGIRNAGFNLIELPHLLPGNLGLNQWMGFAVRWGGYRAVLAGFVENGIRWGIPLLLYTAKELGEAAGVAIRDFSLDDLEQELDDDPDANLLEP